MSNPNTPSAPVFDVDPFEAGVYSKREDLASSIGVIGLATVSQPTSATPEVWPDASRNPGVI